MTCHQLFDLADGFGVHDVEPSLLALRRGDTAELTRCGPRDRAIAKRTLHSRQSLKRFGYTKAFLRPSWGIGE
jgi:hypothetical protein